VTNDGEVGLHKHLIWKVIVLTNQEKDLGLSPDGPWSLNT
jgi:hypothetical protein